MTKKSPTVGVIIPTYNRAHLLRRAINSVLNQTYQNFELIIVDDGSTDDTEAVVKNYNDQRITYVRHEINRGGSAARNTGIKTAKTDFIAFLDSDDEWFPKKLEKQLAIFLNRGSSDRLVVYTGFLYLKEGNEEISKQIVPTKEGWLFHDLLIENVVGTCSTVMFPRRCIDVVGTFDEMLESLQDLDLWIRLSKSFPFFAIKEPLAKVHIHAERISDNLRGKLRARHRIFEKFSQEISKKKRVHGYYHFRTANIYCHIGCLREGRMKVLKAIKINPFCFKYYLYFIGTCFGSNAFKKLASLKAKLTITRH